MHDFIPTPVLERLRADMQAIASRRDLGSVTPHEALRHFWGEQTMRFTRLASRSPAFFDLLAHPDLLAVGDALLLPSCTSYWMNTGQTMILAPGQSPQRLHRDADNWPK